MNLLEIVSNIGVFDEDHTVYAKTPWEMNSEAIVEQEPEDGTLSDNAKGYEYFLEIFIIKEFLEDWVDGKNKKQEEICTRIIQYAINDA